MSGLASPEPPRVLDAVVVLGLTAVVLSVLDQSYSSRAYLVAGLVPAAVVLALGLLVRSQGKGAAVYLLCVSLAYVPLGAAVALRSYEYLGLPTPDAMLRVLTATFTAPGELLTTIPPVDATGQVMVLPYAIGFGCASVAGWLAIATDRPLAPVVPLLVGLVTTILLGTQNPDVLLLRGAVFAGVSVWWMSVRGGRRRDVDQAHRGRVVRGVAGAVLIATVAAVATLAVPDDASPGQRVVLRGHVGNGQDVTALDNPLAGFRRFTRQPPESPDNLYAARLLRVRGMPAGRRLRFVTLDVYDRTGWRADNRSVDGATDDLFQGIGTEVSASSAGLRVAVQVEVRRAYNSAWLPLIGQLTGISFDYLDGRAQRESVRYNPATSTAMVVGGLAAGDDYAFTAVLPKTRLAPGMRAYGTGEPLVVEGAFLDQYLEAWRSSELTPMQKVFSMAGYLRRNGRYSDGAEDWERRFAPGQTPERLGKDFIGAPVMVGNDEQYAAFVALAANRLGVPARVVVGAQPGPRGHVLGRDVSAWVEVRVRDGSWRTLPTAEFMSHEPPRRQEPPRPPPSRYVRDADGDESSDGRTQGEDAQQPGDRDGSPHDVPAEDSSRWLLVVLPGVVVWCIPLSKWVRRRRRRTAARWSARLVGGWRELLDTARDQGRRVPDGLARSEQARRMGRGAALATAADTSIFGPGPAADELVADYWSQIEAERRAMLRDGGALRRLRAFWNPASLLPRLRRG